MARLRFLVTYDCNHDCVFCHREGMAEDTETILSPGDVRWALEESKASHVVFSGGEPFFRPDIYAMLKTAIRQDFVEEVQVVTNGSLLNLDKLEEYVPRADRDRLILAMSIHAIDRVRHEEIVGAKTFYSVMDNMHRARARGYRLRFNFVVTGGDLNHYTPSDIDALMRHAAWYNAELTFVEMYRNTHLLHPDKFEECLVTIEDVEAHVAKQARSVEEIGWGVRVYDVRGEVSVAVLECPCKVLKRQRCAECLKYRDIIITPDRKIKPFFCNEITLPLEKLPELLEKAESGALL